VDNPFKSPAVLSICTGMRGLERGLERVIGNIAVTTYVEIEAFIIYNLVKQMEQGKLDAKPVWTDIKTFPAKQFHGKIHWIIGGYPCQPFSVAGKQQGTGDPRHLWPYIRQAVKLIQPFGCFFENVANHLNIGYREVRRDLEEMGYTVKEGIYSAQEVGAPHKRERLFILAIKLGNTSSLGQCKQDSKNGSKSYERNSRADVICTSTELADSKDKRKRSGRNEQAEDDNSREQLAGTESRSDFINCSEDMANSDNTGLEGRYSRELQKCTSEFTSGSGDSQIWPAGQGEYQHNWEEPRTVESGMGCTIDGYNFRTDLLRMYGNGVVEQTAELAFIDLMKKHLGV
jgi:DNA (cytosine-5)-methyltransferase 1